MRQWGDLRLGCGLFSLSALLRYASHQGGTGEVALQPRRVIRGINACGGRLPVTATSA